MAWFSLTAALVKIATQSGVPVAFLVAVRLGPAAAVIGLLIWTGVLALRLRRWTFLIARGTASGVAVGLYYWAISRIPLALAVTLDYTFPIFAALFAWALLGERPSARLTGALLAATFGVAVVLWPSPGATLDPGVLIALGAAIAAGISVALVRPLRRENSAWGVLFVTGLVGAVGTGPFAAAAWRPLEPDQLTLLVVIAVTALLAQLCLIHGLRYVMAAQGGLLMLLTVPVTALLGLVWLGERPGGSLLLGGGLILAAEATMLFERRAQIYST